MVPEGTSGGQRTLRRLSNASLYFPSKFSSFHTFFLRLPLRSPSPHLPKGIEAARGC